MEGWTIFHDHARSGEHDHGRYIDLSLPEVRRTRVFVAPKWIVLDGDIDPMWIESLNTVMDDNKVLTLASNERIPLNDTMRLLFEISHLKTATPATVSRAGILYVSSNDIGYSPVFVSWVEQRESASERNQLLLLFDKYIPRCLELLKSGRVRTITPLVEVCHIEMLCNILGNSHDDLSSSQDLRFRLSHHTAKSSTRLSEGLVGNVLCLGNCLGHWRFVVSRSDD